MEDDTNKDNNNVQVSDLPGSIKFDCDSNAQPRTNREVNPIKCKRKFPGPAGILPPSSPASLLNAKLTELPELNLLDSPKVCDHNNEIENNSLSQVSADDIFTSEPWKSLVADLGPDSPSLLAKFSIKSMLLKASRKLLPRGKIPLILGVIESMDMQGSDAAVVIRDPTGKMNGSLHQDLIKDPNTAIQPGSVVILRQISVISLSSRTHYLNITPGNIVLIYSTSKQDGTAKRPWILTSISSPDTKVCTKDTVEIPSLKEIIEESEQELSVSLRNFRQNLNQRTSSASSSLVSPRSSDFMSPSSSILFSPRFISSATSVLRASKPPIQRPRMCPPSNISPSPGYSSNLPAYSVRNPPSLQPQNKSGFTAPPQPLKTPIPNLKESRYMISGAEATRSPPRAATGNHMTCSNAHSSSNPTPQHMRSLAHNASVSNLPPSYSDKTNTSERFVHDNLLPDDDDDEILHLCDSADSKTNGTDAISGNVFSVFDPWNNETSSAGSTNNEVIDQVFEDCRREESNVTKFFTHSNRKTEQDLHSRFSVPPSPNTSHEAKSGSEKKFTFKRSVSAVQSSPVALPSKRPMFEPILSSHNKTSFNNKTESHCDLSWSRVRCSNENLLARPRAPTNIVKSHSEATLFKHPDSSPLTVPGVRSITTCDNTAERDSKIQLGQRTVSPRRDVPPPACSLLLQWDDDLNDDLLLSQLTEEF